MKRRLMAALVLAGGVSLGALANAQDLEQALAGQYHDKILVLRHCYTASSQEYDAGGKLLSKPDEGPWPFYGRIQVKTIDLTKEKVRLEGNRVVYQFDGQGRLIPIQDKDQVKVTIRLDQPLTSVEQATAVLGRVFAITQEDVINAAPSYWQPYLTKHFAEGSEKAQANTSRSIALTDGAGTEKILPLGPGVTAPKPLYMPEPQFSLAARKAIFGGLVGLNVIVDSTGRVSSVKIVKPLGMGLDEEAVRTVSTWRFAPATYKGEPVAIAVYVEVDFHFYNRQ